MTEANIGFLYKLSKTMPLLGINDPSTLLRSYYTMRCKELTRGYGLPDKHFSTKVRCPHCCLEWTRNTYVKILPIKLSSRQRKRIRSKKVSNFNKFQVEKKKQLLYSNEMVQICSFCNHSTVTKLLKPTRMKENTQNKVFSIKEKQGEEMVKANNKPAKKAKVKNETVNVYTNAFDIFSIKNDDNTLKSTIKDSPKIIKNNKRKKDKFAGLCQKAVMASIKIKKEKEKSNKLNLFLKPSNSHMI